MTEVKPLLPLTVDQAEASTPDRQIWLAASAGTGKTQVLAARVLRLLLNKESPETILCLTFTKGGAAEMAERIHTRLASWVRAPAKRILSDLAALGEPREDEDIAHARTLFAHVLDARGGGLRIQTIHSFCQTILASFPAEANLTPGFRPLDEREALRLSHSVLADLVSNAVSGGDTGFITRLQRLVLDKHDNFVRSYLQKCARNHAAFEALGSGLEARIRRSLDLPSDDIEPIIMTFCSDTHINRAGLETLRGLNTVWASAKGKARAAVINDWLAATPEWRSANLDLLVDIWRKKTGELRSFEKGQAPQGVGYAEICLELDADFWRLIDLRHRQRLADQISSAALVGQQYARAYADAKRALGLVDFEDLIAKTAALLRLPGMGDWIRYKLDSRIYHILVDEAQDTNDSQWDIIKALAEEFYAGSGAVPGTVRTIFTVGDTKQSIFGFQGSDPEAMTVARAWFDVKAQGAGQDLQRLTLLGSFRSSPQILALVDEVIQTLGPSSLGANVEAPRHDSQSGRHGHVLLLKPVLSTSSESDDGDSETGDGDVSAQHALAREIAKRVAGWIADELPLEVRRPTSSSVESRPLRPGDVMILLRSRSTLAKLIVAHLAEAGVPVAGVDRLRLNTPLVVRDLLSAMNFVLQPNDDLNLACLLVSPLLGWSQEDLQAAATRRGRLSLWRYLRATASEAQLGPLRLLLSLGDRMTPTRFIEAVLTGDLRGRAKCFARFGLEARDPLDELLTAAITFERDHVPTLQGFVDWFERDMDDIKRDPSSDENAVRVLTVHGAKGLQAPLVILADATVDPDNMRDDTLEWPIEGSTIPVPMPRKAERVGDITTVVTAKEARSLEEHWRLLYVALTRAEERLVIMGTRGARPVSSKSWYSVVERAMVTLGTELNDDESREYGDSAPRVESAAPEAIAPQISPERPDWIDTPAPAEARPARPLSPSAYTADQTAAPPAAEKMRAAAERGRLLHMLFERLPAVLPALRSATADRWLNMVEGVTDPVERATLIADALGVIDDPRFADIFSPDALAEAPLAGVVEGVVIAGTADRLLITPERVMVVDFKTTRRFPARPELAPESHLRQMAAYAAVLEKIFPERHIVAALLYTAGPVIHLLDDAILAAHKPSYQLEQQVLAAGA